MIIDSAVDFPFNFQGLNQETKEISISATHPIGALVTPLVQMTRLNLNFIFADGSSLNTDIDPDETLTGTYAIVPRWGLERSKHQSVHCTFRWWPDSKSYQDTFKVID